MPEITPAYRYRAIAERVHDGDTFLLRVDLGFDVSTLIQCRLRGVDTPELNTVEGKKAAAYVTKLLAPGPSPRRLIVESYKDRRSFARWVCDVWMLNGDGYVSLAEELLAAGQAKPLIIP